jgi:hypothetical protein
MLLSLLFCIGVRKGFSRGYESDKLILELRDATASLWGELPGGVHLAGERTCESSDDWGFWDAMVGADVHCKQEWASWTRQIPWQCGSECPEVCVWFSLERVNYGRALTFSARSTLCFRVLFFCFSIGRSWSISFLNLMLFLNVTWNFVPSSIFDVRAR